MKTSSIELLKLSNFIMSLVNKKFEGGDYPFIDSDFKINSKKLDSGSLSLIIIFELRLDKMVFVKSINVIMTYNDKMGVYNVTVTGSEFEGLKILYTHTSSAVDDIIKSSETYLNTIIDKAITKLSINYMNQKFTF